jgi:hypothetical protein
LTLVETPQCVRLIVRKTPARTAVSRSRCSIRYRAEAPRFIIWLRAAGAVVTERLETLNSTTQRAKENAAGAAPHRFGTVVPFFKNSVSRLAKPGG